MAAKPTRAVPGGRRTTAAEAIFRRLAGMPPRPASQQAPSLTPKRGRKGSIPATRD